MDSKQLAVAGAFALALLAGCNGNVPDGSYGQPPEADPNVIAPTAKLEAKTNIGDYGGVYEYTPATRPDVTCFVAQSFHGISIDCVPK